MTLITYHSNITPMTTPQSEVKCCDRCKDYDPCYKISCPCHHPKESPVSQSVEGWEKRVKVLLGTNEREFLFLPSDDGFGVRPMTKKDLRDILSSTLSTLVKEMEGKIISNYRPTSLNEKEIGFNAGISAAVEVVKKMEV
mgnify:CR=1 FL=1